MRFEHGTAELVDLALHRKLESLVHEPEVHAADTGEE